MGVNKKPKASYPLIDTNVFIGRKLSDSVLDRMYLSSVVLYELIAANIDDSTFKLYSAWRKTYSATDQLLTPTATDWFECFKTHPQYASRAKVSNERPGGKDHFRPAAAE